ncbi:ATP-binding protein [Variovorax sp. CY25R-8]|uniref:ATP-binding protein n=1 Tax=Variovorax sp. CY25R-8 TaxID=2855501 RepID=UPI0021BB9873|nr:ATP-binding protein [Variovorax sp. CY25R-8]
MASVLGDWIDQRQPGGSIYGPSRFGKTRGMRWHLKELLSDRFGKSIPLHMWTRPPDSHASESEFWRSILAASGHRYAQLKAHRGDRRRMLQELLISTARQADGNFVALLIDEAQAMSLKEWTWLLGLQNALDWEDYCLSVFSVSSHQMGYQYQLMAHSDHAHVAARFMVANWQYPGLSCEGEISYVLQGYDSESEWPRGSGFSYLKYFAPEPYARGERLTHCASTLWRVLNALLPEDYGGESNFPMQHLTRSVEKILINLARGENWEDSTSEAAWLNALIETRFTDHMRLISSDIPRKKLTRVK